MAARCPHVEQVRDVGSNGEGCEECLELGETWVQLRVCLTCGHVGCCDSSRNRHITKHYRATGHPIVRSLEPGEEWSWRDIDEMVVPGIP